MLIKASFHEKQKGAREEQITCRIVSLSSNREVEDYHLNTY